MSKRIVFINYLDTILSYFRNDNTSSRVYQFQDKSGTIAHLDDVASAASQSEVNTGTATGVYVSPSTLQGRIDTDGTLAANSDVKIPSQKAVKTYVDSVSNAIVNVYHARDYGLLVDGQVDDASSMTSGNAILTSTNSVFASGDVNKKILVQGAGSGGADLSTYILSFQSSTQVTLATNCLTSINTKNIIWGTDDSAALNTLINTTIAGVDENSEIIIPFGICILAGALQDTSRRNAQIVYPVKGISDKQITIKISGQYSHNWAPSSYSASPISSGTRICSFLTTGNGATAAIFGGTGPVGGDNGETNYLCPIFKDLIIQTVSNPVISAFYLAQFTDCAFEGRVSISAGFSWYAVDTIQPTTTTSYGLFQPKQSKGIYQSISGTVNVMGFYNGINVGELANIADVGLYSCVNGIVYDAAYHPSYVARALCVWCLTCIKVTGVHYIHIDNLAIERWTSSSTWYKWLVGTDVSDSSNYGLGKVFYNIVTTSQIITRNGGFGIDFIRMGEPTKIPRLSANVLAYDSFTDANGTSVASHSMDIGAGWTRVNGTGSNQMKIYRNVAHSFWDTVYSYGYVTDVSQADVVIKSVVVFGAVNYNQIIFRHSDTSNYLYASCYGANGAIAIYKVVAGVTTSLATGTATLTAGRKYVMTLTLSGNSISFRVGGTTVSTTESFNNTATKHGFQTYHGGATAVTSQPAEVHEFLISLT